MTDYFATLQETRRPWIDTSGLKPKFLVLCAEVHPDRVHGGGQHERAIANDRASELNAAYQCLCDPKKRLQHLLKLELGYEPKEVQRIPPQFTELLVQTGQLVKKADVFLAEKAKVGSPLLKVQLFEKAMAWTGQLNSIQQQINSEREQLESELRSMNPIWEALTGTADPSQRLKQLPLERLQEVYCACSYLARTSQQIQERLVALAA